MQITLVHIYRCRAQLCTKLGTKGRVKKVRSYIFSYAGIVAASVA